MNFETTYSKYNDQLRLHIGKYFRKVEDLEDVLQETWLEVFRDWPVGRDGDPSIDWLLLVASNNVKDAFRGGARGSRRCWMGAFPADVATERGICTSSPADARRVAQINEALAAVEPELRELATKLIDGCTERDIAVDMGISQQAVHRKVGKLRVQIKEFL